ncbi:hypothetical protein BDV06DRAFT_218023 [Aspergillus oleicola]
MNLPPETRNQIYSYLFLPQRVEISRIKSLTINTTNTKSKTKTKHAYHRLISKLVAPRDPETQVLLSSPNNRKEQTQLSLPFVCKQSYNDTLCPLYACTQFVFTSPKCISRFMWKSSKAAIASVNHIELHHIMYNEPSLMKFRHIKLKADKRWYELCERISLTLEALEVLHVNVAVYDAPIELEVGESWSQSILALGKGNVKSGKGGALRFARVKLRSDRFDGQKISTAEKRLEGELMNPVAMQIREDERVARELEGPRKAGKVLRLVFN